MKREQKKSLLPSDSNSRSAGEKGPGKAGWVWGDKCARAGEGVEVTNFQ